MRRGAADGVGGRIVNVASVVEVDVAELTSRWGRLRLATVEGELRLEIADGDDEEEPIRIGYVEANSAS